MKRQRELRNKKGWKGQKGAKGKKGQKGKKVQKAVNDPLFEKRVERFCRIIQGKGFGLPPPGSIRIQYLPKNYNIPWKINTIMACDRTLGEWYTCISSYLVNPLGRHVPEDPNPLNPFFRHTQFAQEIRVILMKNIRFRWLQRKYIYKLRMRIMNRRIVGDEDLYTTLPIPEESLVAVYDIRTRNLYRFHTQTIMRIIINALNYSCYGIARPTVAKNPYTNLSFTYNQLIRIVEQIIINLARNHRMIPDSLYSYRTEDYNIAAYTIANKTTLYIHAAKTFFANKDDTDVIEIYGEIMEDVYEELDNPRSFRYVTKYVTERKVREDLQKRWDAVIVSFWIYQNHRLFYTWNSYQTMLDEFDYLHHETFRWLRIRSPRVLRRPVSLAAAQTQGLILLPIQLTELTDVVGMLENIMIHM